MNHGVKKIIMRQDCGIMKKWLSSPSPLGID